MPYRVKRSEELTDGVRRVAGEQLDRALGSLDTLGDVDGDRVVEAVHDVRKRCKKVRGLVRLVRPGLGDHYRSANDGCRDAARLLGPFRDAHAMLESFDALVAARADLVPGDGVGAVRAGFVARAEAATREAAEASEEVAEAALLLHRVRESVDDWEVDGGFDAVEGGVAKTYRRAQEALTAAEEERTAEAFHEWRKRMKYLWYHTRLLSRSAPGILGPLVDEFDDVSDALGDDHDLAVITEVLDAGIEEFGGPTQVGAVLDMARSASAELRERARRRGARLLVEEPEAFTARLRGYWGLWHDLGGDRDAGDLDDLADRADHDDRLADLTVIELRALARDAGVSGRSSMDRAELVAAMRAAGSG